MPEAQSPLNGNETRAGRVRLMWRWKESGKEGAGPWSHRLEVVELLAETLNRRFRDRMEHWVEVERDVREPNARV